MRLRLNPHSRIFDRTGGSPYEPLAFFRNDDMSATVVLAVRCRWSDSLALACRASTPFINDLGHLPLRSGKALATPCAGQEPPTTDEHRDGRTGQIIHLMFLIGGGPKLRGLPRCGVSDREDTGARLYPLTCPLLSVRVT